jgi:hypothetical protein
MHESGKPKNAGPASPIFLFGSSIQEDVNLISAAFGSVRCLDLAQVGIDHGLIGH